MFEFRLKYYWLNAVPVFALGLSLSVQITPVWADGKPSVAPVVPKKDRKETLVFRACLPGEKWLWPTRDESISSAWVTEFDASLSKPGSRVRGFSEALALRRLAQNDRAKAFAEYWMSRDLYEAGLVDLAKKGFDAILERESDTMVAPFQFAALGCLLAIHRQYAGFELKAKWTSKLKQMNELIPQLSHEPNEMKSVIWESAMVYALDGIHDSPEILKLLKGSGPYEALSLGVLQSSQDRFRESIESFKKFFALSRGLALFEPFINRAHLLSGRSHYALGQYKEATLQYQAVAMQSNEYVHSLSELSWAYLMDDKYREAIGTSIGLQSGGLKGTFSPESLMVMAMSLNEMCRFPESMGVIKSFRKHYRDSFFWLEKNKGKNTDDEEEAVGKGFYRSAIEFAGRNPNSTVPSQVASEWIRSAIFISNQERINLVFKEKELANQLSLAGKKEQKEIAIKLLSDTRGLLKRIKKEKIQAKPGEGLSVGLLKDIDTLKEGLVHFRRFKNAAPVWRKVLASHQAKVPEIQAEMVKGINQEISRLNRRMKAQLEEIAENNDLIEVEILNGASGDIIWQNAHPGYAEEVKKSKTMGSRPQADRVWNWGTTQGGFEGRGEIWEDELGSLKADLYDNCESRQKYKSVERES